jgi:hypothetical protein
MPKRLIFLNVAVAVILLFSAVLVAAQPQEPYPIGEVTIHAKKVSVGVGYTWGTGTLKFKGKTYPFKVTGLSAVGVGYASISAKGDVYNLKTPSDLAGTYAVAEAGAAVYKGPTGQLMRNDKGVVINMKAEQKGVAVTLGAQGLTITME